LVISCSVEVDGDSAGKLAALPQSAARVLVADIKLGLLIAGASYRLGMQELGGRSIPTACQVMSILSREGVTKFELRNTLKRTRDYSFIFMTCCDKAMAVYEVESETPNG
jgi:hypothetical protein